MGSERPDEDAVCIRAPNWVGDVVMATPTFRAVRRGLPDSHVSLVIRRRVEPIVRGAPWFDRKIVYEPGSRPAVGEFFRCVGALRERRCGLGLLLPNSFSSALMFRLAGVRRRVGYRRDCRSLLLTDPLERPHEGGRFKPTYMVDYYLGLCERTGIEPAGRRMELFYSAADAERAERVMQDAGLGGEEPLFLMHPGAGYGPSKRWPAARFARLAELLAGEYGGRLALIGGPSEAETVAAIRGAARVRIADLSACGIDLHLLKCVVARSSLLVTTDSGPRHYGVALGVPTVCVMGPTHPGYSTGTLPNDIVVRVDVDCGPCQLRECPRDHRCMEEISAESVLDACRAALETTPGAGAP